MIDTKKLIVEHLRNTIVDSSSFMVCEAVIRARSPLLNNEQAIDPVALQQTATLVRREVWGQLYGDVSEDVSKAFHLVDYIDRGYQNHELLRELRVLLSHLKDKLEPPK